MSVTNNRTLHDDVRDLAELPPSESPIVSCYLDLRSSAPTDWKGALVDRFSLLRLWGIEHLRGEKSFAF